MLKLVLNLFQDYFSISSGRLVSASNKINELKDPEIVRS
jgi:hypothetical protein